MRLVRNFEQSRFANGADGLPGLYAVARRDGRHDGEIGILRDVAVRVVDDDGRAEEFIVINRRHDAGTRGLDRRSDRRGQIDARVRPPVLRRGVILQRVDAVGGLRAAGNGPDAHVLRRLADGLVRHGGCRSRFLLRSGGRGRLLFGGRIFGRFFRAGGNGHRLLPQCFLLGDGAGHEQPARNAYRAYAQRQNDVVALFAEKAPDPLLVRMIFVCLHDFAPPRLSMCQKPED